MTPRPAQMPVQSARTPHTWPQQKFLAWLDALRASLGLPNDARLAAHLGIGHTLISGWRAGKQRPSLGTLITIAQALEMDPRPLWVLAGILREEEAGTGAPPEPLPRNLREVLDDLARIYRDGGDATRATAMQQLTFLRDALSASAT